VTAGPQSPIAHSLASIGRWSKWGVAHNQVRRTAQPAAIVQLRVQLKQHAEEGIEARVRGVDTVRLASTLYTVKPNRPGEQNT
jgi:aspartate aminotransferase-like enzyme